MPKEIGVIGLGLFGLSLCLTLKELGHRVVALERDEGLVQRHSNALDTIYSGDATDKSVLEQLRFQDLDQVVVGVGSMDSSIMIVLNLQELKAANIIAKANTSQHATVLERLGVRQVVQPQAEIARHLGHQIHSPGLLDYLPVGGGTLLQQAVVDKWAGSSLADLKLPSEYGVMVVAEKKARDHDFHFVPDPMAPLEAGTELLLIGPAKKILRLRT